MKDYETKAYEMGMGNYVGIGNSESQRGAGMGGAEAAPQPQTVFDDIHKRLAQINEQTLAIADLICTRMDRMIGAKENVPNQPDDTAKIPNRTPVDKVFNTLDRLQQSLTAVQNEAARLASIAGD